MPQPTQSRRIICGALLPALAATPLLLLLFLAASSSPGVLSGEVDLPFGVSAGHRRGGSHRTMYMQSLRDNADGAEAESKSVLNSISNASMSSTRGMPLRGGGHNHDDDGSRGRRRLQKSAKGQNPQQLVAASFEMGFRAPVISIALTHLPKAGPTNRKYFMYWRAIGGKSTQSAATVDIDTMKSNMITTNLDQFCNGPIVLADGNPALFGGYDEPKNKLQADGRKWISVYDDSQKKLISTTTMLYGRWYPTPCMITGNKVLIVGGTSNMDKGPMLPVAELWDPAKPTIGTVQLPLPPTFKKVAGNNWYPFVVMLPRGEILWWGDRGGSITDANWNEIYKFPDLPKNTFPYRTMYPYTSSIVLGALKPDPKTGEYNTFSVIIFGGAPDGSKGAPAAPVSARLDMSYCSKRICDNGWVIEDMAGQRRVMPTTTVLPNGKVLVHAGAQAGVAGWKSGSNYKGTLPAYLDLMYDPNASLGKRYSLSATLGIIRMYHTTSCLDLSGKVISAGCETCGMTGAAAGNLPATVSRSPDGDSDFRISFAVPTEIGPGVERPVIVSAPQIIKRGSVFTVFYTGTVTGATLAAPCANTHSINMNQRVLFLNVVSVSNGVARVQAPPLSQPAAAHEGYYQLFLLGAQTATGKTYSKGLWVKLVDK
ncbi:hypothetical protein Vretifemale_16839 [Volvox reticuliferus]|uniref:Galactose oxidase-like Early set domain-containing protein n=1 Tax=Volvox reticuliferus TaxID=1737510 RepID=A0A8J4CYA9_9CHLO|nr:hypothetical protein Vretifemale_16839 [Volvox reticuliferus]